MTNEINKQAIDDTEQFNICEWYPTNDGALFNPSTGERITKTEAGTKMATEMSIQNLEQINHASSLGVSFKLVNVMYKNRRYTCHPIKQRHTFNKMFRVDWRDFVTKSEISNSAFAIIAMIQGNIKFPTNSIIINGKAPNKKEFMEFLRMSKNTFNKAMKELVTEDVIRVCKEDGYDIYYFNPFLIASGGSILYTTYELFKDTKYNKSN